MVTVLATRGDGIYLVGEQPSGFEGDGWIFNAAEDVLSRKQPIGSIMKFGYWTALPADADTSGIEEAADAQIGAISGPDRKYAADQPRDDSGRWTSGGGAATETLPPPPPTLERPTLTPAALVRTRLLRDTHPVERMGDWRKGFLAKDGTLLQINKPTQHHEMTAERTLGFGGGTGAESVANLSRDHGYHRISTQPGEVLLETHGPLTAAQQETLGDMIGGGRALSWDRYPTGSSSPRTLTAADESEFRDLLEQHGEAKLSSAEADLAAQVAEGKLSREDAAWLAGFLGLEDKHNPYHVAAGSPEGGQFTDEGSAGFVSLWGKPEPTPGTGERPVVGQGKDLPSERAAPTRDLAQVRSNLIAESVGLQAEFQQRRDAIRDDEERARKAYTFHVAERAQALTEGDEYDRQVIMARAHPSGYDPEDIARLEKLRDDAYARAESEMKARNVAFARYQDASKDSNKKIADLARWRQSEADNLRHKYVDAPEGPASIGIDARDIHGAPTRTVPPLYTQGMQALNEIIGKGALPENANTDQAKLMKMSSRDSYYKSGRSYHWGTGSMSSVTVHPKDSRPGTIVHEMGHWLEEAIPNMGTRIAEHLNSRTRDEMWVPLNSMPGNKGYRSDEIAKPDAFYATYMGKGYGVQTSAGVIPTFVGTHGSEFLSMSLQKLYESPADFARQDPQSFDFTMNLLAEARANGGRLDPPASVKLGVKYAADQPRDESGRWTSGGGNGHAASDDDPYGLIRYADKPPAETRAPADTTPYAQRRQAMVAEAERMLGRGDAAKTAAFKEFDKAGQDLRDQLKKETLAKAAEADAYKVYEKAMKAAHGDEALMDKAEIEYARAQQARRAVQEAGMGVTQRYAAAQNAFNQMVADVRKGQEALSDRMRAKYINAPEPGTLGMQPMDDKGRPLESTPPQAWSDGLRVMNEIVGKAVPANVARVPMNQMARDDQWYQSGRSYQTDWDNALTLAPKAQTQSVVHELGHYVEAAVPGMTDVIHDYLNERTAGEKWQSLSKLTGKQYKSNEQAKPDAFYDPYMGKNYGTGGSRVFSGSGSEFLSMSLQGMYQDPVGFAKKDPQSFDFTLALLDEARANGGDLT